MAGFAVAAALAPRRVAPGAGRRGHGAMETMSKSKDEHALHNELRRQKAAELIAAQLRKRQRERTDEALLSSEQARRAAGKPKKPSTKK